ncbi:MAG: hypothetical protein AAFQ27_12165 [Pseudomonadota bacterium]
MATGTELAFLATLMAAQSPVAQEQSPQSAPLSAVQDDSDTIIVTAPREETERRIEIRRLAGKVIRKPRQGYPIARFFLPVCPKVYGLSATDAEVVEQRIRHNAREFGPGQRRSKDCDVNLKIVLLANSVGSSDTWLTSDSEQLSHLLSYQKQRVLEEEGPVRAWNVTALRTADGGRLEASAGLNKVPLNSRLTYPVTSEITSAMMLIEFDAVKTKTLQQLADYASMRAFLGTEGVDGSKGAPVDTILTLFHDEVPPEGLTEFDQALMDKLYSLPRNANTARIFGAVASRTIELENASGQSEN